MQKIKTAQEIRNQLAAIHAKLKLLEEQNNLIAQATRARAKGTSPNLAKEAAIVLKDIQDHPGTARKEIAERTKIPAQEVTKVVTLLQEQERAIHLGSRRTTRWFSPEVLKGLVKP